MKEKNRANEFKREQSILGVVRFLAFPLGWFMYYVTEKPFGETVAIILSVAACLGFWIIVSKGREKALYDMVAFSLRDELEKVGQPDYRLEMKNIGGGLILRFFFFNAGEKLVNFNRAIYRTLSDLNMSGRSWIVQIAEVSSEGQVDRMRETLDMELLEEIEKAKEEKRDIFDGKGRDDKK